MRRLFTLLVLMALPGLASAQQQLPLLQVNSLVRQGSFTIPQMTDLELHWTGQRMACEYVQGVIAFNAANNSLFFVCHDWTQTVAEISIPPLGGVAVERQRPQEAADLSLINRNDPNSKKIGGLFVLNNRLLVAAYSFYDGASTATASHFSRPTDLSSQSVQGPVRVGSQVGFTGGYMAAIPTEWQSAFGGTMLTGQCCLSVIGRSSLGPAVSVFSPTTPSLASPTAATPLVGYPLEHPALGACASENQLFNCATSIRGVVFVPNTRSVLFFGTLGVGAICYKNEGPPACRGTDGYNASDYVPFVWAYDANDLLAVKNRQKDTWEIRPYATWVMPGMPGDRISGAAFDPATGRLFLVDPTGDGTKPRIHVYSVNASAPGSPSCTFRVALGGKVLAGDDGLRMDPGGAQAVLSVTASASSCVWSALSGADWLSVSPTTGAGSGQLTLVAAANPNDAERSTFLSLPGVVVSVSQSPGRPGRVTIPRPQPRQPLTP